MISQIDGERLGKQVLTNWTFDASRFTVNHIKAPDLEYLHNHPWEWCWSLILNGGYTHEYFMLGADGQPGKRDFKRFKPGDVNFMPHALYHRIHEVEPDTYTFMFKGPDHPTQIGVGYWADGTTKAFP